MYDHETSASNTESGLIWFHNVGLNLFKLKKANQTSIFEIYPTFNIITYIAYDS